MLTNNQAEMSNGYIHDTQDTTYTSNCGCGIYNDEIKILPVNYPQTFEPWEQNFGSIPMTMSNPYSQNGFLPDTLINSEQQSILHNSGKLPESITNPLFMPSYLTSQIGKVMSIEFLLGNSVVERTGRLVAVGANYILLKSIEPGNTTVCDIDSIKFATILDENKVIRPGSKKSK